MSAHRLVRRLVVGVLALAPPVYAASPGVTLNDYVVASWTTKDGLPSAVIWGIAQDRDGYLWLGTNGGLVRFDGVQFVMWDKVGGASLPKVPVHSLYISRDGTLWAGFSLSETGGISRIRDGQLRTYGESDGLAPGTVNAIIEDSGGIIWAGTNTGLFRLRADRWEAIAPADGLPTARVDSLYVDRQGNLLVGTAAGVFRRLQQSTTFQQVDSADATPPVVRGFSEDRSGRVWVTDPVGGYRILGDHNAHMRHRGRGNKLLHDRNGDLWVTTMGEGIWRVTHAAGAAADSIEEAYAPGAREIFEDREGQIWADNGEGLIRFARPKVTPITDIGLIFGVQAAPDGGIWATTPDSVIRFPGTGNTRTFREELQQPGIRTFRVGGDGVLWVASSASLVRVSGDRRVFPLPATARFNRINDIADDRHGGLWISDRDRGVFRFNAARPAVVEPVSELAGVRLSSMIGDTAGRLWFATTTGRIGVTDGGTVHVYGPESGLGPGLNSALYEDSRHVIWVGGNDGLKRFIGDRFVHINQGNRFRTVLGITEDSDGDLWLGTTSGIVHVSRSELDKASDPAYEVYARVFDAADGLAGLPARFENPSQVRDRAGRLWFVTQRGITAFDPRELKAPHPPIAARIERVVVDEQPSPLTGRILLPAGAARVAIDYSVLDLATPWRTQFRYRLDGFDDEWIDAGTHREAVYTRLPPRSYTFHVAASQPDGSWNEVTADWTFAVAPRFYQTYWFYALSATALGLVTWAVWQMRIRRVRRQFALLIGERARLSREIHDTLLQSLVGVALQFDALGAKLDAASPERQQLVRIRKEVEQYIREARHSIWNLRKPVIGRRDLPGEMQEAAQRMTTGHDIGFDFVVRGTPYECPSEADEQLMRICQEAVLNAVRHAEASSIRVELRYDPDAIVLRVTDDGRGFDPETTIPLEAAGHYGLVSMRERASQVGGVFTVTTSARQGTSIEARVPAGAHA